jgi:hypothetical protein
VALHGDAAQKAPVAAGCGVEPFPRQQSARYRVRQKTAKL